MLRSFEPRATKVAPSAIMIAGWSFPGSPLATFPPIVPRLRTSGSAISGTASARIGYLLLITSERSSAAWRSEEHTSELQSHSDLVCRLLLEKKKEFLVRLELRRFPGRDDRRNRGGL